MMLIPFFALSVTCVTGAWGNCLPVARDLQEQWQEQGCKAEIRVYATPQLKHAVVVAECPGYAPVAQDNGYWTGSRMPFPVGFLPADYKVCN